ncbi:MAG: NAD(P)-dependent oxidoreductase [Rhodococcus sp. (in: high G+C Gram-positive bacteria)]
MAPDARADSATLFVGLGKMGEPMVRRYGPTRPTFVYDVSESTASRVAADVGGTRLTDLAQLPAAIDTVILMLPNSTIVESVLLGDGSEDGVLAQLPAGALVIDMGSSRPASTRMLAAAAAARGIDLVDAPVSGGVAKAAAGTLSIMLGGTKEALARATAHVRPLGAHLLELGPAGSGHAAKALNNWLSAANLSAAAEILSVAVQSGIAPEAMIATLNASTGRSQATEVKYPNHILSGAYDSGFDFDLMLKDLRIGNELAGEQGTYSPILTSVLGSVEGARAWFDRDGLDHTEMARFYEEKNGVTFGESAPEPIS